MTPESNMKLDFDCPFGCLIVMIGRKYLNRIGYVMEKVLSVTNDHGERKPLVQIQGEGGLGLSNILHIEKLITSHLLLGSVPSTKFIWI